MLCKNKKLSQVLITGNRKIGGLRSFRDNLEAGFAQLGLRTLKHEELSFIDLIRALLNRSTLKILSTRFTILSLLSRSVICVFHGYPNRYSYNLFAFSSLMALHFIASISSKVVYVSHYTKACFEQSHGKRSGNVIGNPVRPLGQPKGEFSKCRTEVFAYFGRLHKAKNLKYILTEFEQYSASRPEAELWIIGDGPDRQELENISNARVTFLGEATRSRLAELLEKIGFIINACETEAFGMSVAEALCFGKPVIVPLSGGPLELLPPTAINQVIFVYPVGNIPGRMKDAMELARSTGIKRIACDTAAKHIVNSFDAKKIAEMYLEVF